MEREREGKNERERDRETERRRRDRETQREGDGEIERERLEPQPPFGPSVGWLRYPCITTTHLSYIFPILETSATALCGLLVMILILEK